jgi:predicted nucleotidyltransferase
MATLKISADFKDFLRLLTEKGVEYLVIGGYAVSLHGYSRPTGDLDIWIRSNRDNALRTSEALDEFGYAKKEQSLPYLLQHGKILRMGFPPFRLEVSTAIDGVDFNACYENRISISIDEIPVTFIGYEDLITNKLASARLKDLADVEELKERNK